MHSLAIKKRDGINLKIKTLLWLFLFLYLIAITAFQLGTGFDALFVRITFAIFVVLTIITARKIYITAHFIWCLVFWGLYFLSLLWSSNINDTLYYVNNAIQIVCLSLCLPILIRDKKDIALIIKLIVISILIAVIRLYMLTPSDSWGTERLGEAIGMNSNGLGMRLSIASVMSLYLVKKELAEKGKFFVVKTIFYLALMILFAGISLFTGSRKAIAVVIAGLAIYEVLTTKSWWKLLPKILIVVIIAIAIINIALTNETIYKVLGVRLERMFAAFNGNTAEDWSITERNYYIVQAINLFMRNPILGSGGNGFVTFMRDISYSHVAYSHNNVSYIRDSGIFNLLFYLGYDPL